MATIESGMRGFLYQEKRYHLPLNKRIDENHMYVPVCKEENILIKG